MIEERRIVIPGDFLGTSEEFTPGRGVYDEKGNIYASVIGEIRVNKRRVIDVIPRVRSFSMPKEGDIVIGRVEDIKDSVVIVSIAHVEGRKRYTPTPHPAIIHISNIKSGFVSEIHREFGYLDIIRARVIDAKALRLSTEGRNLGVIRAICSKCKGFMRKKGRVLVCERCKRTEIRKIAEDYGNSYFF
ncbi:MAG: exosome complex RNA-binding protein Csl4 [Candidatus Methanospirareceae archaeon]